MDTQGTSVLVLESPWADPPASQALLESLGYPNTDFHQSPTNALLAAWERSPEVVIVAQRLANAQTGECFIQQLQQIPGYQPVIIGLDPGINGCQLQVFRGEIFLAGLKAALAAAEEILSPTPARIKAPALVEVEAEAGAEFLAGLS